MAKIISLSLPEKQLKEIDLIQKELGFAGRSELIRAGLHLLQDEQKKLQGVAKISDALLLVSHSHDSADKLHYVTHDFHDIIKTQLHSELANHMCLDLLIVNGRGERIQELYQSLLTEKKLEHVRLVVLS